MSFALEHKLNWLYTDVNSYFATIEQQLDKSLRKKAIAIVPLLSDSTCAIAASYEAKLCGIKTGTKIHEAKKLCPELICIESRHKVYVDYHQKIFQEIDKYLQVDHVFSIDEGACRLTGKYCELEEAIKIAQEIKLAIRSNVGDYIGCSIGIASNRYLAKIATNFQKVDGLVVIKPTDLPHKLYSLALTALPGIGQKTYSHLLKNKISTIQELCTENKVSLAKKWGSINGEKIWSLIRGIDLPLEAVKKSTIGHSQVLGPDSRIIAEARNVLLSLILRAASRLRSKALYTNSILLTIDLMNNEVIKFRIRLVPSCDNYSLVHAIMRSWDELVHLKKLSKVRKVGISFNGLSQGLTQLSFDYLPAKHKQENLSKIIDELNSKLGQDIIRQGLLSKQSKSKEVIAFGYVPISNNEKT